jgi:rubrerythrin
MSIVESLVKLVDPAEARRREEARRQDREQPQRADAADPPPEYQCRVCGLRDRQSAYCPTCLADTMQGVAAPAR